jgi:predicted nucleic acid-binding protein
MYTNQKIRLDSNIINKALADNEDLRKLNQGLQLNNNNEDQPIVNNQINKEYIVYNARYDFSIKTLLVLFTLAMLSIVTWFTICNLTAHDIMLVILVLISGILGTLFIVGLVEKIKN